MKKYWFLFLCLWMSATQAQTLRDAVVVVRPNYTENTVKFLTDFSASLRRDGYKAAADLLTAYSKGGYGTGFVWLNSSDGRYYVITNRHVVAQAKDVNIELMPADAPQVKYEGCRIVAVDEGSEMALIALPDSVTLAPLHFSESKYADGDEVYTAGFPGLGGDPSWQLGKGIVSNSSAKMKDWTVQKSAKIIQHTAQVDPGSSGGPLLVREAGGNGTGYSVIGVNTWQARNRENANFSVAATTMQEFIAAFFAQHAPQSRENLQSRAQAFAQAIHEGYREVYPYISDDYIGNMSVNNFYELLESLTDSVAAEAGSCFGNGMPVDGVRIGLAEALSSRFSKKTVSYSSISSFRDSVATVVFDCNGTQITSDWTFRNGQWGMSNFSALDMRDMTKSGVATSFGYKRAILLGYGLPANNMTKPSYSLSFEYTWLSYVVIGFDFNGGGFDESSTYTVWKDGKSEEKDTVYSHKYKSGGLHGGVQLPIKAGQVYLIPNIKFFYGLSVIGSLEDVAGGPSSGYSVGFNCSYKLRRSSYLIGGLQYKSMKLTDELDATSKPRHIEFVVGITF